MTEPSTYCRLPSCFVISICSTAIVKRYYDQDTWKENLIFEKDSFELLQDILEDAGELTDRTAYENLVQTEYAQKACEN